MHLSFSSSLILVGLGLLAQIYRSVTYSDNWLFLLFYGLLFINYFYGIYKTSFKGNVNVLFFVFGSVGAAVHVLGSIVYTNHTIETISFNWGILVQAYAVAMFVYLLLFFIISCSEYSNKFDIPLLNSLFRKKYFSLVLFFSYFSVCLIAFVAYFPGCFSYDMPNQTAQVVGLFGFDRHHPPLHTFIWGCCVYIAQYINLKAVSVYGFFQMLVLASTLAYVTIFIRDRFSFLVTFLTIIFFLLNPVIHIFSIIPTKDSLFGCCFLLTFTHLVEIVESPTDYFSNKFKVLVGMSLILLCCLLRNNAVYAVTLLTPFIFLFLAKFRRILLIYLLIPLLSYFTISGPIMNNLSIGSGNEKEMLSIPMQQIARVVYLHGSELSSSYKEKINIFIPYELIEKRYNYRFADPIKDVFSTEAFKANGIEFLKLWLDLFLKYPFSYIDAFLDLHIPYWYLGASAVDKYSKCWYIETGVYKQEWLWSKLSVEQLNTLDFERKPVSQWLLKKYEKVASFEALDRPILRVLFSLALPFWLIFFALSLLCLKKQREAVFVLLFPLLLWITFIAGPVSNCRYIFPLILSYPIFFALLINSNKIVNKQGVY